MIGTNSTEWNPDTATPHGFHKSASCNNEQAAYESFVSLLWLLNPLNSISVLLLSLRSLLTSRSNKEMSTMSSRHPQSQILPLFLLAFSLLEMIPQAMATCTGGTYSSTGSAPCTTCPGTSYAAPITTSSDGKTCYDTSVLLVSSVGGWSELEIPSGNNTFAGIYYQYACTSYGGCNGNPFSVFLLGGTSTAATFLYSDATKTNWWLQADGGTDARVIVSNFYYSYPYATSTLWTIYYNGLTNLYYPEIMWPSTTAYSAINDFGDTGEAFLSGFGSGFSYYIYCANDANGYSYSYSSSLNLCTFS